MRAIRRPIVLPKDPQTFSFDSYEMDLAAGEASFHYTIDRSLQFTEKLVFHNGKTALSPAETSALDTALRYLHIALGVSYFKAFLPPRIEICGEALSDSAAQFFSKLYQRGLGEFAYVNQLDLRGRIVFPSGGMTPKPSDLPLKKRTVVPIGGGKDSLVTVELLRHAGRELCTLIVGDFPLLEPLVERIGLEHLRVSRRIDPLLFEMNREGAYNGHVPFSSLLAFMMPVAAVLQGFDTVVMSQERSADSGNMEYRGEVINHQYSKSFEFEEDFSELASKMILTNFSYFSLLRPLSELSIAERFSRLTQYHSLFTSCNRAFRINGAAGAKRWCCDCPKCRFVFLVLAPYLGRTALVEIFSADLLSDPSQASGYRELLGFEGHKPFECVGEVEESRAALLLLAEKSDWSESPIVQELLSKLTGTTQPKLELITSLSSRHRIPDGLLDTIYATR